MPRASCITPELVREVAGRRAAGEAWKVILRDMRHRSLPATRKHWREAIRGKVVTLPLAAGISAAPAPPQEACIPT